MFDKIAIRLDAIVVNGCTFHCFEQMNLKANPAPVPAGRCEEPAWACHESIDHTLPATHKNKVLLLYDMTIKQRLQIAKLLGFFHSPGVLENGQTFGQQMAMLLRSCFAHSTVESPTIRIPMAQDTTSSILRNLRQSKPIKKLTTLDPGTKLTQSNCIGRSGSKLIWLWGHLALQVIPGS